MMQPIPNSLAAMAPQLAEWRRDLHRHPELSNQEVRTAGVVAEKLRSWGLDAVETGIGGTGVVGVLHGRGGPGGPGEAILLRADMDALPMPEESGFEHASVNDGVMHACGHDGHTTMLLGAARHLSETRNFAGTVYFCFQPAEEAGGGAQAMIADGLFEKFPARAVYGMHNWPGIEAGKFAVRPGPVMAGAAEFHIEIRGRGGHAAKPNLARDPVVAGAQIVTALQTIVSRKVDPLRPAVVTVGAFNGGTACNIIADEARISGTCRSFHSEVMELITEEIQRICRNVAEAMGVEVTIDLEGAASPPVLNDTAETAFATGVLEALVGGENVDRAHDPTMGGEDFAFMAEARPGCFVFIGNGDSAPLHTVTYDFNDEITALGAAYWTRLVETALPTT